VLQAHGFRWGAPWTALFGLIPRVFRVTLPPFERLFGLGDGLVGRPFCGGHGTRNRFDQLVLPREHVRRVMRLQRVCHRGQQPGRCLTRGLEHPAVARCQGRCHAGIPRRVIAGLSQLFHNNEGAVGVHRDEAKAAGKRFGLGHRAVFWGHAMGHACGFIGVGGPHRWFHVDLALLRSPIGGRHKAVQTCQMKEETPKGMPQAPTATQTRWKAITSRGKNASPGPF